MRLEIDEDGFLSYPTVFISDIHLGKKHARADMLYEFLTRLKCQKLFIVGDAIEGWGMMKAKHRKFDEMSLRVIDAINGLAAQGVEVIYLPGNHDERLRAHWDNQKQRFKKAKSHKVSLFRRSILDRNYVFKDPHSDVATTFHLTDETTYVDPQGRRMHVLHGDQFDPRYLRSSAGKFLAKFGDAAYDLMIEINGMLSKVSRFLLGKDFSFSKHVKSAAKRYFSVADSFAAELTKVAQGNEYDGLVCGHIHTATVSETNGALYVNSGDWVESCTAAMHDGDGNWMTLDWVEARTKMGFKSFASEVDPHLFAAYRGVTQQQLKWIQRLWPAKDFFRRYKAVKSARRKFRRIQSDLKYAWQVGCTVRRKLHGLRFLNLRKSLDKREEALALY